jgi:hypothetical protein
MFSKITTEIKKNPNNYINKLSKVYNNNKFALNNLNYKIIFIHSIRIFIFINFNLYN